MPIMAKLGVGLLVIPQKPWEVVKQDLAIYRDVFEKTNQHAPPPPFCGGFYFVDKDPVKAEEMAMKWIGDYYHTAMKHYEMASSQFGTEKGYEFYRNVSKYIGRHGQDSAAADFAKLMPWGTPKQVLEKIEYMREILDMNAISCNFSYAGMPYAAAEASMRCFAEHVLPELKKWKTAPFGQSTALNLRAA